jgi:plastocyanin
MQLWNTRRALVLTALTTALLALPGSALAVGRGNGKGPAKAKITIKGGTTFKANGFIKDSVHFSPGPVTVSSGGTVTVTNTSEDEHTLSIVKPSQLPRSLAQIENCAVCGEIAKSHGVNPEGPPTSGPPPIPLVNVGGAGFDTPGDSIAIGPKGHGSTVTFKVTAAPGTTLTFMCAIHPWMQGRFQVK